MTHSEHQTAPAMPAQHASVLAILGLIVGLGMTIAIIIGMAGGKVYGWKPGVSMLIMLAMPICTIGTAFAVGSLVWRKESKRLGQFALWINGMIAVFGFPLLIYWLLGMN